MTPESVAAWGELARILQPSALERGVPRDPGVPTSFPLLDFEPDIPTSFYDQSPYDFSDLTDWRPSALLELAVARARPGPRLDAGCGGGRNVPCLMGGTDALVVIDLSLVSVSRVASKQPVRGARASVLRLPFVDDTFELVVCDGVAHTTPDPEGALRELVRVTRPGGLIYTALYRSESVYRHLYHYLGGALRGVRKLEQRGLPPVVDRLAFAGYKVATRLLKPDRTGDESSLRSLYDDYFLTPLVSFHSRAWVTETFSKLGAPLERIEASGNVWRSLARKQER